MSMGPPAPWDVDSYDPYLVEGLQVYVQKGLQVRDNALRIILDKFLFKKFLGVLGLILDP